MSDDPTKPSVQDSVTEQAGVCALEREAPGQTGGDGRVVLRIVSYRTKLLDIDNLVGGSKSLVDCLALMRLIPSDAPHQIKLEMEQVRVATRKEERTVICLE